MSREFVLTVYIFFGWLPEFFVSSCFCFHFSRYGLWQAGFCCSSCMRCLYTFMYAEAAMVISCQRRAFGIWHHPVYGSRKCFFFLLSLYCFCCMDRQKLFFLFVLSFVCCFRLCGWGSEGKLSYEQQLSCVSVFFVFLFSFSYEIRFD